MDLPPCHASILNYVDGEHYDDDEGADEARERSHLRIAQTPSTALPSTIGTIKYATAPQISNTSHHLLGSLLFFGVSRFHRFSAQCMSPHTNKPKTAAAAKARSR